MKSLFGYGVTTKAIAKSGGWAIFDDKFEEITKDEFGNILYPSTLFNPDKSSLEITSPGIPPSHNLIKKAKNLISELDYFYNPKTFQIWITGTNGKTTTTQMIHHLVKGEIGGNIGIPLANLDSSKIWSIEVSSFQLHYTKIAKPNIFVVLPIKKDHLSWHGNFENYINDKLSVLQRLNERDIVIMPKSLDRDTKAYKILYKDEFDLIKEFNFKKLYFKTPFLLDEVLAKVVNYILFFDEGDLKDFKIDSHKMEKIVDKYNRVWINDSKATNIDATINALKRYQNKEIFLILGGVSKGQDFTELFEFLKNLKVKLYIIGSERSNLIQLAKKYHIEFEDSLTLENAVKSIDKELSSQIAILSPASASFDQFNSYKERGEKFKDLISKL